VKPLLGLAVLLSAAAAAGQTVGRVLEKNPPDSAGAAMPAQEPCAFPAAPNGIHPAVVRIIVPDRGSTSLGSGSLVAVSQNHGLVVTNWHVVRDATGPITVAFPDGFRSLATVLQIDRDWDLAALAIWRPNVEPIPLAAGAPQLGEPLAIAGYGDGPYRALAGRCTQYVSPGGNQPFEMVELSVAARNGDSGGPILNTRGELAGVLFGSARGETTGSYCGRVRWFLTPAMESFWRLPPAGTMIAAQGTANPRNEPSATAAVSSPSRPVAMASAGATPAGVPIRGGQAAQSAAVMPRQTAVSIPVRPTAMPIVSESGVPVALHAPPADADRQSPSEASFWEQVKNVLAAIGAVAILLHSLRLLASAPKPSPEP
jgi:hypothetical protein